MGIRPRELDWPAKLSQVRIDNTKFTRCEATGGHTKRGTVLRMIVVARMINIEHCKFKCEKIKE